jgi:hypothetical protein
MKPMRQDYFVTEITEVHPPLAGDTESTEGIRTAACFGEAISLKFSQEVTEETKG